MVFLLGFCTLKVNGRFALETAHVASIGMLAHKQNHQLWLEQSGHFTRGLTCIQLSFQTLSTHSKPPIFPTQQQALNVHCNSAPFQKDAELLGFAQIYYECDSLAQICADVFLGSLPHKDTGIGKVMCVAGCSKLANLFGS